MISDRWMDSSPLNFLERDEQDAADSVVPPKNNGAKRWWSSLWSGFWGLQECSREVLDESTTDQRVPARASRPRYCKQPLGLRLDVPGSLPRTLVSLSLSGVGLSPSDVSRLPSHLPELASLELELPADLLMWEHLLALVTAAEDVGAGEWDPMQDPSNSWRPSAALPFRRRLLHLAIGPSSSCSLLSRRPWRRGDAEARAVALNRLAREFKALEHLSIAGFPMEGRA